MTAQFEDKEIFLNNNNVFSIECCFSNHENNETSTSHNSKNSQLSSQTTSHSPQTSLTQLLTGQNSSTASTGQRSPNSLSPSPSLHSMVFNRSSQLRNSKNYCKSAVIVKFHGSGEVPSCLVLVWFGARGR